MSQCGTALLTCRALVGVLGQVYAASYPEPVLSRCADHPSAAVLHPVGPAQIETPLGEGGSYRARDVWPSFGPIQAQSAEMATGRIQRGKVDSELGEKSGARLRDFSGLVADHDVFMRD